MALQINAAIPTSVMVDPTGNITPAWRALLMAVFGNQQQLQAEMDTINAQIAALQSGLAAETSARTAADASLNAAITDESHARQLADSTLAQAIQNETAQRQAADALLVPKAQLATLWSQADLLSILPTTDPGGGLPWNNGGIVTVGP
jgi:hypothetical protein